jgi:hypothetical protein
MKKPSNLRKGRKVLIFPCQVEFTEPLLDDGGSVLVKEGTIGVCRGPAPFSQGDHYHVEVPVAGRGSSVVYAHFDILSRVVV